MRATLVIDENAFYQSVMAEFERVKIPCQDAMADRLYEIVDSNLGDSGEYRPAEWKLLGEDNPPSKYAKKVGRPHATLRETGRMGATIDMEKGNSDYSSVFTGDEIASAHQFGLGNLSNYPRPFFPIINGEVTQSVADECVRVCERELIDRLK